MKSIIKLMTAALLGGLTLPALAFYSSTLAGLKTDQADQQTRTQLMSVLETCGIPGEVDDPNCVLQGLTGQYSNVKDPSMAQNIVQGYQAAMAANTGNANCRLPEIFEANNAAGTCVLMLHYRVLETLDLAAAKDAFDNCVAVRMGGLAVQGNVAAQIMMTTLVTDPEAKRLYNNMLKDNVDPEYVKMIASCF